MAEVAISSVHVKVAGAASRARGVLGFATVVMGEEWRLDGITIRLGRGGAPYLMYPRRRTRSGSSFPYVSPTTAKARERLLAIVVDALLDAESMAREHSRGGS